MDRARLRRLAILTAALAALTLVALYVRAETASRPATGGTQMNFGNAYWTLVGVLALLAAGMLFLAARSDAVAETPRKVYAAGAAGFALSLGLGLLSGLVILLDPASGSALELVQSATAVLSLPATLVGFFGLLFGGGLTLADAIAARMG